MPISNSVRGLCAILVFALAHLSNRALADPAQPWAGAALSDWSGASQAVLITDLSRCEPRSALSEMVLKRGRWKLIPYRMTSGSEGVMIWAPPEGDVPEVSLPLEVEGWYAIFVGVFSATEAPTMAWLRLDGDPAPVPRYNKRPDYGNSEETFFRVARLQKGIRLRFSAQTTGEVAACGITHVKLLPLSDEEVARIEAERRDASHRVLSATNDGFSDMFHRSSRNAAALLAQVEIFRDTDFGTLILHAPGADKVNYLSGVGYPKGSHAEIYPRVGDRHFVESVRALAEQGINPFKVAIDRAHEIGMTAQVGIRPAGRSFFEPYTDYWESPFFKEHPEWRCEDRDGTPVTRMSWAVPEVRAHLIDLFREMVRFGADGANLVFTRGYPLVLYEPPARRLFQEEHSADPRDIPESDPRITAFRSDVVTTFFKELRAMLDEEGRRRGDGKRLALSAMINGTAQDDLFYGLDLRRLAAEKLVDEVFTEHGFGATTYEVNMTLLRDACQPAGIPFSPGIYHSGTRYANELPKLFGQGAHGLAVFDAETEDIFEWCWISRFGHVAETEWRLKHLNLKKPPRTVHGFQKLGDQVRDGRYGPHWGG